MKTEKMQIAIDGPGGAGKSTVAKAVARSLGIFYLDTGAMYRALAYAAGKLNIPLDQEEEIENLAQTMRIQFDPMDWGKVWCNGEDVSLAIRSPEISKAVSVVAAYPRVRQIMVRLQQLEAAQGGIVMDGRDIGTHVLPDAGLKVFLTASPEERARRRWKELKARGKAVSLEEVKEDLLKRDRMDEERAASPLKPAEDAIIIDTTDQSVEALVDKIVGLARGRS